MSYLKKIVSAALLALAAMAFAGAGSAAAEQSVFCKVNETPCATESRYPKGTALVLKAKGPITWTTYGGGGGKLIQLYCEGAEFEGETTTAGGSSETVAVTISTQMVSSCSCPFETRRNAKFKFNWTSGTMNASASSEGPDYRFLCYSGFWGTYHCTFEGNPETGVTLTGGNPGTLAFKEAPMQVTGPEFPCGKEARLNVEFEVSTPKPLYVSSG